MAAAAACMFTIVFGPGAAAAQSTILFVTQPPFGADFATVNAVFGNHRGTADSAPRGGDLYIRYPDGTLRNLTAEAGYGTTPGAEIAVREPSVHWSGEKALFAMAIGGTVRNDASPVYFQIYEVSGLGRAESVQIRRLPQPETYNNVAPIYGTDDRIIFTSDRPHNGDRRLYPQLDEYESAPTVTGLWSMKADGSDLKLLDHSPSGNFTPIIAADGRIIFTRWDHLQRDQQNSGDFGAFNYVSEGSGVALASNVEFFPEPLAQAPDSIFRDHRFNAFFPWQMNEDGSDLETLNHIGRHELVDYAPAAHDGLPDLVVPDDRRTSQLILQLKEDPNRPGYFYGTAAPEFGTHASGMIIGIDGGEEVNADDMEIDYITDPLSVIAVDTGTPPPPGHPGHFRNPVPLSGGDLIAVRTSSPYADRVGNQVLSSLYDFHLVRLERNGAYLVPGGRLNPGGIVKSISYFDNARYTQVTYSGPLWELDPVEVRARPRPSRTPPGLPDIEMQILADELDGPSGVGRLRAFLEANQLALVVSRNVTRRADRQQDYNLKINGSTTQTAEPGATPIEIAYLQFFQGDLIRGYANHEDGRRPLAQPMHDGLLPETEDEPAGSVRLGTDGSMAAFVPARRALTWQLTSPDGEPVVRERYWVTFQPGEMRACANCHGLNRTDTVLDQPSPTNPPEALRELARWWRENFDGELPVPPTPLRTCGGDCSEDGRVTVDEVLTGVAIALDQDARTPCARLDTDGDGLVKVDELVAAVLSTLRGCAEASE